MRAMTLSAPMRRSSGKARIDGANFWLYASTSADHWPGSKVVGILSSRSAPCCGDTFGAGSVVTGARARALATIAPSQATVRAAGTSRASFALALKSVPPDAFQPTMKGVARSASSASCVCATRASSATDVMPRAVRYGIKEAPPRIREDADEVVTHLRHREMGTTTAQQVLPE